jgi:hypothetical protein
MAAAKKKLKIKSSTIMADNIAYYYSTKKSRFLKWLVLA